MNNLLMYTAFENEKNMDGEIKQTVVSILIKNLYFVGSYSENAVLDTSGCTLLRSLWAVNEI